MLLDRYWETVDNLYHTIRDTQRDNIIAAGQLIADTGCRRPRAHLRFGAYHQL